MGSVGDGQQIRTKAHLQARWALLTVPLLIGMLSLVTAPSATATAADQKSPVASDPVEPFEVQAYEGTFGVSQEVAERNLETQHMGTGIVEQLEAEQGKLYAGVWFDNDTGEFVVPKVPGVKSEALEASLDSSYLGGDYRLQAAQYTWAELEAAQTQLDQELMPLMKENAVSTSIDPRTDSVIVYEAKLATAAQEDHIEAVSARQDVAVKVQPEPVQSFNGHPFACDVGNASCDPPPRAGIFIEPAGVAVEPTCTAGFKAVGKTFGNWFMLTAGHCYRSSEDWAGWNSSDEAHYLGHINSTAQSFPNHDYAAIKVNGYGNWWYETAPGGEWPSVVAYWGGSQNIPINYESSPYMGELACHSGWTSKSSCGSVTKLDYTETYDGGETVYHMIEVSGPEFYGIPGDSGGPLWTGNTALGITSGGNLGNSSLEWFTEVTEDDALLEVTVGAPAGTLPYTITGAATGIEGHKVTGNGTVDPNGAETTYHFEYGTTTGYGSSTSSISAGSAWGPGPVSGTISGLVPATTYHYRIVATNSYGTVYGSDAEFKTPPVAPAVTTGQSSKLGSTAATLSGTVNAENSSTTYWFEYGHTTKYGLKSTEGTVSGTTPTEVSKELTGLEFGTAYHYRLTAKNSAGTTSGSDGAFTVGWRLQENHPPSGAKSDEFSAVSCVSVTNCMGVGNFDNSSGVEVPLAEQWNGSEWEERAPKAPTGATRSSFQGVSCPSTTSCTADGFFFNSVPGKAYPFAERWNGSEWETPTVFEPELEGKLNRAYLFDISCGSTSACMAVGYYLPNTGAEHDHSYVERWNGTSWLAEFPKDPERKEGEPTKEHTTPESVSCASATDCVIVGIHEGYFSLIGYEEAYGMHWNGSTWTSNILSVKSQDNSWLNGVSCSSTSACTAIGSSANGHNSESVHKPLAERWNGTSWTEQESLVIEGSPQTYFESVACPSASSCLAVGSYSGSNPVAMRWNGSSWELQKMVSPTGKISLYVARLSCSSVTSCMAVGNWTNSSSYHGSLSESYQKVLPATLTTKAATGVGETEATLKGNVNPNGSEAKYWFEYGTTTSYGTKTTETSAGSGSSAIEESKLLTGLTEGTKYHFRIAASNSESTAYGKDEVLETKVIPSPTVTTKAATSITESGATLNGSVNPNGHETKYWFEYGLTTGYGTKTAETSAGSGSGAVEVNSALSGLELGTKYHFRLSASNGKATVNGKDETFETEAGIKGQLAAMKVTDPFNETTSGISNFGTNWSVLGWAEGTSYPKGIDRTTGWGPNAGYPTINGAYYQPTVTNVGSGIADEVTLATNPGNASRYFSLWLDMGTPGTAKSGYELRFTDTASNTYTVTLSKWKEGTQTVLAMKEGYSLVNGNSVALADPGNTVSAWSNTGSGFSQILSASDNTFEGGNAGVEGAGNITRLTNFKVGSLLNSVANTDAALKALHLTDAFATNENPLSESGAWAALSWDTSTSGHNTGQDTTSGWGPYDAFSTINGAYWQKASFADTGSGDAATALLGTSPGLESRFFVLWLNTPNPASAQSGYALSFTVEASGAYLVNLTKWTAGSVTVLASKSGYSFATGSKFALVDKAGTVSAWTNTGTEYTQLLSASDSTYASGYSGVEGAGNFTRLKEFRSGQMAPF